MSRDDGRKTPHRTPLRRISQGSLFALSRSNANSDAPHGLGFLEPALSELVDEAEALQANCEGLRNLSDSLSAFNESFASWLYVMNMNALTIDWPQAPTDASLLLAKRRAEPDAQVALAALQTAAIPEPEPADRTTMTEATTEVDFSTTQATTNVCCIWKVYGCAKAQKEGRKTQDVCQREEGTQCCSRKDCIIATLRVSRWRSKPPS